MKQALLLPCLITAAFAPGSALAQIDITAEALYPYGLENGTDAHVSPDGNAIGNTSEVESVFSAHVYTPHSSGTLSKAPSNAEFEAVSSRLASLALNGSTIVAAGNIGDEFENSFAVYWPSLTDQPIIVTENLGADVHSTGGVLSPNGAYVTGYTDFNSDQAPFLYSTAANDVIVLPVPLGQVGLATSVSNDGKTLAGAIGVSMEEPHAAFWYSGSGFAGTVVDHVGTTYSSGYLHVNSASNTTLSEGELGYSTDISADGSTIVGFVVDQSLVAVKWTRTSAGHYRAATNLGTLGGAFSEAYAVNANGTVIVGRSETAEEETYAFRYTSAGMKTIEEWVTSAGVENHLDEGVHTESAEDVSGDGTVVVGTLSNNIAYLARVLSSGESGLVTLNDLSTSLSNNSIAPSSVSLSGDLVLHGNHGHPLMRLAPQGKMTAWINGDFGINSTSGGQAYTLVPELGIGKRLSNDVQVNLALGKIYSGQKTIFDGSIRQNMTYILPEIIANIPDTPVWGTLSFQYASGSVDVRRGYLNLGSQDYSWGSPQADIYSARARFDWKDALSIDGFGFTPYIDHQHSEVVIDSYSETGGGFPAHWNNRHEHDDISRIGIDVTKALTEDLTVTARAEQNRWWQGKGAASTGEVVGVSTFDLPGTKRPKDWSSFSLGAYQTVGEGQLSATANASTSGQNPQYWLSLGYQYNF